MHIQTLDVLTWILGKNSAIFQILTLSSQRHALPEIEDSLLLRCFEEYVLEACACQNEEEQQTRGTYFEKEHIVREVSGWLQKLQKNSSVMDTGMDTAVAPPPTPTPSTAVLQRIISMCILVRDFEDIRVYVEGRWQCGVQECRRGGGATANTPPEETAQSAAVGPGQVVLQKAWVVRRNLPHYRGASEGAPPAWDTKHETWLSAEWSETLARIDIEAKLVLCAEIIQHGHDALAGCTTMCVFLGQNMPGVAPYTPDALMHWYAQDSDTDDMQMICDVWNYGWCRQKHDNMHVPAVQFAATMPALTVEIMRVVAVFCSNLVYTVRTGLLQHCVRIDLEALKVLVTIYDNIQDKTESQQKYVLDRMKNSTKKSCWGLHKACSDMQMRLRMYVYHRHMQGHTHTAALLEHLVQSTGCFSARENVPEALQQWIKATELSSAHSTMASAIILWGGSHLAEFCTTSQCDMAVPVHKIQVVDNNGRLVDASHLFDDQLFQEYFEYSHG